MLKRTALRNGAVFFLAATYNCLGRKEILLGFLLSGAGE